MPADETLGAQTRIEGGDEPRTWDGEPLWSPSTVREGLFDPAAFEQLPGQMPLEDGVAGDRP